MNFLSSHQFLFTNLLCFCALAVKYDPKLQLVTTNNYYVIILTLWGIVGQCFYFVLSFAYVRAFNALLPQKSVIAEMVHVVFVISVEIVLTVVFINAIFKKNRHVMFLNKLLKIEEQARKFGPLNYHASIRKKSFWILGSASTFFFIIFLCKMFIVFPKTPVNSLYSLYYMEISLFMITVIVFFCLILQTQRHLFRIINCNVAETLKRFTIANENELHETLDLHNELRKSVKDFSDAFGILCVACMLHISGDETSKIFNGMLTTPYSRIVFDNALEAEYENRSLLFNSCINFLKSLLIISIFYHLSDESEQMHEEADKIYNICNSLEILPSLNDQKSRSEIISMICVRSLQKRSYFTANGFFLINKSVMFSVRSLNF